MNNYLKTEFSYDTKLGNYTGYAQKGKFSFLNKEFKTDKMIALKGNNADWGVFGEYKINTPPLFDIKFGNKQDLNCKLESRTRLGWQKTNSKDENSVYLNERLALKTSYSNDRLGIYNITGLNSKVSNSNSVTPMVLTGVEYQFGENKKFSAYFEYEGSKPFNLTDLKWKDFKNAFYLGGKYTF